MGWSASSSCSELCPSSLHCTADLCALQQTLHISPAGQPCPHAWARASTDVSDTTCPSYLPAMGPDVARRPGTAQPRRPDPRQPDTAQPTTNAFHTTFSRGNSAGKEREVCLKRGKQILSLPPFSRSLPPSLLFPPCMSLTHFLSPPPSGKV